jgi:hypothetical protein
MPQNKTGNANTQEARACRNCTEESRLQSILAISVVSTKNASLQSQSHFDYDGATIR